MLNPFILFMVNSQLKNFETFICSLLNTYLAYDPNGYDLPYLSKVCEGENEMIVKLCLHLFVILNDFKAPSAEDIQYFLSQNVPSIKKIKDFYGEGNISFLSVNSVQSFVKNINQRDDLDHLVEANMRAFINIGKS